VRKRLVKAIVNGSDGSCSSVDGVQSVVHSSGIASITTSHLYRNRDRVAARRGLDVCILRYRNKVERW